MTAPLVWLLAAALSVTTPHAWQGPAPLVSTSPGSPVAHTLMKVAASGLPHGVSSANLIAGKDEHRMRPLGGGVYRADLLAPVAGPLVLSVRFWRLGTLYAIPGGTVLVRPKR